MQLVADRLGDLEKVLGVEDSGAELESRLDTAAITSSVRMVMLTQIPSGAPVHEARISSGYGKRTHPVTGKVLFHRGQDFAVNIGTLSTRQPMGWWKSLGRVTVQRNFLRLQHAYGFSSSYSHLQKFAVKSERFCTKRRSDCLFGYITGLSSGPHLHYEVRFVGRPLNPKPFVDWGINDFESLFEPSRRYSMGIFSDKSNSESARSYNSHRKGCSISGQLRLEDNIQIDGLRRWTTACYQDDCG
ncbi:M23 family metallopeptidase [Vibrio metschnikovii]